MIQLKQHPDGALARPAPLFASSWAALFAVLRSGPLKSRRDLAMNPGPDKTDTSRNP